MTIQLIDIAVTQKAPHPRLLNRTTGRVRAVLSEERDGQAHTHELSISVWTDIKASMNDDDVDMALMLKAARIVSRLKASLEPGRGG